MEVVGFESLLTPSTICIMYAVLVSNTFVYDFDTVNNGINSKTELRECSDGDMKHHTSPPKVKCFKDVNIFKYNIEIFFLFETISG